jgi:alkanesulfonate monooxygenase SsuD/methylene tetrahydromethanopterin reductase-like flavin-dependent oxidoreductase (luciferase family)
VAEYGDGWLPMLGEDVGEIARGMASVREAAERAGRPAESISVSVWGVEEAEQAEALNELGVDRLIFKLEATSRETLIEALDRYAEIAARVA